MQQTFVERPFTFDQESLSTPALGAIAFCCLTLRLNLAAACATFTVTQWSRSRQVSARMRWSSWPTFRTTQTRPPSFRSAKSLLANPEKT